MSMPQLPDVTPDIELSRRDINNMLLASIAFEELALAHMLNAEAEKLQEVITSYQSIRQLVKINDKVREVIKVLLFKEIVLSMKLQDVLRLIKEEKRNVGHT
ncbi:MULTISPECIES: hypothetical protein [Carboxydocella]|nr:MULTISPECIES: hypothetical protein [Carboxydocella]